MSTSPGSKFKLSVVTDTYLPDINGVAISLFNLLNHLPKDYFEIQIIRTPPNDEYQPQFEERYYTGFRLPIYRQVCVGFPNRRQLEQDWRSFEPDLILVETEGLLGYSAMNLAQQWQIPVISFFHTNFHQYGQYYGISLFKNIIMAGLRRFHNKSQLTLVPSREMEDALTQYGFSDVELLGHGVDCKKFNPKKRSKILREQWNVSPSTPVLLYVGRVAAEKNIELFLESAEKLRLSFNFQIVVVGDGPELHLLRQEYSDVIFTGQVMGNRLSEIYASADIFCLPSTTETFGLVTLEAMASGLPIVAFDNAAASEWVRPEIDGFLAPLSNQNSLCFYRLLSKILSSDYQVMGQQARIQTEKISWASVAKRFIRICNRVTHEHSVQTNIENLQPVVK